MKIHFWTSSECLAAARLWTSLSWTCRVEFRAGKTKKAEIFRDFCRNVITSAIESSCRQQRDQIQTRKWPKLTIFAQKYNFVTNKRGVKFVFDDCTAFILNYLQCFFTPFNYLKIFSTLKSDRIALHFAQNGPNYNVINVFVQKIRSFPAFSKSMSKFAIFNLEFG